MLGQITESWQVFLKKKELKMVVLRMRSRNSRGGSWKPARDSHRGSSSKDGTHLPTCVRAYSFHIHLSRESMKVADWPFFMNDYQ